MRKNIIISIVTSTLIITSLYSYSKCEIESEQSDIFIPNRTCIELKTVLDFMESPSVSLTEENARLLTKLVQETITTHPILMRHSSSDLNRIEFNNHNDQ